MLLFPLTFHGIARSGKRCNLNSARLNDLNLISHVAFIFSFGLGGHRPLDNPKPQQRRPCCPKGKYCPLQRLDWRVAHRHRNYKTEWTRMRDARRADGCIWSLAAKFLCLVQMPWSSSQRWAVHPDTVGTLGVLSTWCQRTGTEWIRGRFVLRLTLGG